MSGSRAAALDRSRVERLRASAGSIPAGLTGVGAAEVTARSRLGASTQSGRECGGTSAVALPPYAGRARCCWVAAPSRSTQRTQQPEGTGND